MENDPLSNRLPMEAWLVECGQLCLGVSRHGMLEWVSFTDSSALRFADEQSASHMLILASNVFSQGGMKVSEHRWG